MAGTAPGGGGGGGSGGSDNRGFLDPVSGSGFGIRSSDLTGRSRWVDPPPFVGTC